MNHSDACPVSNSQVSFLGSWKDGDNCDRFVLFNWDEQDSIIADAPAEYSAPLGALERFYIAYERRGCHLIQDGRHTTFDLGRQFP